MNLARVVCLFVGSWAVVYALAALFLLPWLDFGVAVAVAAVCVVGYDLCDYIESHTKENTR